MNINILELINSLNLIYYTYDSKKNMLIKDANYSNRYTQLEFFKLTYHLSQKNIFFTVLEDKSIKLSKTNFNIKGYLAMLLENVQNNHKNIFLLNDKKVKWAKNIPLFKITYTPKDINFEDYDAVIFTSKNAISAIDFINKDWKKIPAYTISEQTAKLVKDLDGSLEYVSKTKHGDEFAYEIAKKLQGKKVLYLRGKDIVSDLINILNNNKIDCSSEIIYENKFNKDVKKEKLPKGSKIIFSSPSTIKYFFKVFSWDDSYTAISIGKTTAKYFPSDIKPIIANNTSFQSCVEKALEIS